MTDWIPRPPNLSDKLTDWETLGGVGGEQAIIVNKDVIDIGAEWGLDALIFASKAKTYVACDGSPLCIEHLRKTLPKQATVTRCDLMERWPWADESADTVLDFSSLDDSTNPKAGYREAWRVLRPKGILVTSYANEDAVGVGSNYTASRPGELADWMRRFGFRIKRRHYENAARAVMICEKREEPFDMVTMEQVRRAWTRAQGFPIAKESVYSGHAEAHGFDKEAGNVVLEYGCGGGSDTLSLLRRGCRVYFADVTHSNVEVTRSRVTEAGMIERATGLALDASDRLPIADGILDAVTSHGVIHHIEDPLPVMCEFFRVLKPGGRVYVMLYTEHLRMRADTAIHTLARERGLPVEEGFSWFTDGAGTPWAEWYTVEEGRQLLTDAGFENTGYTEYNKSAENENRADFRTFAGRKP